MKEMERGRGEGKELWEKIEETMKDLQEGERWEKLGCR